MYALFANNYCTCFSNFIIGAGDAATRVVAPRKSLLITVFFFRLAAEVVLEILGSLVWVEGCQMITTGRASLVGA